MTKNVALKIVVFLSFVGILFSGTLTYRELFLGSCNIGALSCGTTKIFTMPACVYGLAMYVILFTVALVGNNSPD